MLSARLRAVADLVPLCERVIDIGTDHAYLPIYLAGRELCDSAIAADKRPGPLKKAKRNIQEAGLEEKVALVLSDGLGGIDYNQKDVIVIAGMGGLEMTQILANARREFRSCVLQPMKSLPELRRWLGRNYLEIRAETITLERGRCYVALLAEPVNSSIEYDDLQIWAGPCLLTKRPAGFREYLKRTYIQLQKRSRGENGLYNTARKIEKLLFQLEQGEL